MAHALPAQTDVLIIGSGIGGATLAAGLAGSGARVVMLERGEAIPATAPARDARAIFGRGHFRPKETWRDGAGRAFSPGTYYVVGGNSKFYGAVLLRYRREDFAPRAHAEGDSPGWPFPYETLEPWYGRAETLFRVRGPEGEDPTEPPHSTRYPHPPLADEPAIAEVRERLRGVGLTPFSLPLAVDIERWLAAGATPWDGFPDTRCGKLDAETAPLAHALRDPGFRLITGARVRRLLPSLDGRKVTAVEVETAEGLQRVTAGVIVLSAGAVNSAAVLLASGIANRSDSVGRYFMNHNCSAILAVDPRRPNPSVYQKTLGINDFYLSDGQGGPPLGNIQLLGKISGPILKPALPWVPERLLGLLARYSTDWYAMSEDLPRPDSRVTLDGDTIRLDWRRSNMRAHHGLVKAFRARLREAGYPIVLTRLFDQRTPSHQCGTTRMGTDPATSVVDPFCRSHEVSNLFVVDAGFLPTSAAVNPALTIAAQALRVADHLRSQGIA
ncbi:MAG: FAD-dependent oxidoreductase [Elstera sp.]